MKKEIFLCIIVAFFTTICFSIELQEEATFTIQYGKQISSNEKDLNVIFVQYYRGTYCHAQTTCWNGSVIWCEVSGSLQRSCRWRVIPGRRVDCKGFDDWGNWQHFWSTC